MNRRRFLTSSALTAASYSRVLGANDRPNIGMIGLGGRGRALTGDLAKLPDARVSHLCDVDQANLERASKLVESRSGVAPKGVGDMRRLLDDKSIDAVFIATPDHWHAPAAILAADAGKDVYVEKPCSHNIREGRLMIDAARRNGRIMQVGTQARSRPPVQRAIEYVRSGKLGKVKMAKAWNVQMRKFIGHKADGPVPQGLDYETWLGPAPWIPFNENRLHYNWHWHWHFGTGDMGNDGVHQLDIARWALDVGAPTRVSGMASKLYFEDDQQTPDTMNVVFEYPGAKALLFEMRIWNPYAQEGDENGVAVYGDQMLMHIGKWEKKWGFKVFDKDGKLILEDKVGEEDSHAANFVESIRARKLPNADIAIGHTSTMHAHMGNIIARTGRNFRFDEESETVIDDPQANLYVSRKYRTHWGTPKEIAR